jgi:putative ABC transport system permease protein
VNLAGIAFAYLRSRGLNTLLIVALAALGVATITLLMLAQAQFEDRMTRDARGIDLVVGAKGSPMQLILSSIYHLDAPTGNIPLAEARKLQANRLAVRKSMPLALGDSFRGFRIVGTTHDYVAHYGASVAEGRTWEKPMEALLGADVAARAGLRTGATLVGSHGLGEGGETHEEHPYTVVGVLARTGTVIDRLVLTSVESVWHVHDKEQGITPADRKALGDDEKEITALLIQFASPLALATLPRTINTRTEMQAASPAFESARLFRMMGVGMDVIRAFALVLVLAAALSVFVALSASLADRRTDLAILRMLGATPGRLFALLMLEGVMVTLAGALIGMALGHGCAEGIGAWLREARQADITGRLFVAGEWWIPVAAAAIGALAALVPAWRAARTDVAATLASG